MAHSTITHPLKKWRLSKGLTLAEAAARVGTSRQVWHAWEIGRRRPHPRFMLELRKMTGGAISADDFFCGLGAAA
jgi:transcriptional regulator with XRE-family HTH domain